MRDGPPEAEGGGVPPPYIAQPGTTPVEPNSPEALEAEALAETEAQIRSLDRLMAAQARLAETIDAYRASLLGRGYTPSTAEVMTIDYHRYLLTFAIRRTAQPSTPG